MHVSLQIKYYFGRVLHINIISVQLSEADIRSERRLNGNCTFF